LLQAYSIEAGKLKAISTPFDPAETGAAIWIDLWDTTPDEVQTVEQAVGIKIDAPAELNSFYISDQVQSSNGRLLLKGLLLAGLDQRHPTLVPVTFIRTKGPLITISKGSPDGLAWLVAECQECGPEPGKDVFPVILDMIIDHATNVLDLIGSELDKINRRLFQHHATPKRRLQLLSSPRHRIRQLETILTELGYCREVLVKLRRSALSFRREAIRAIAIVLRFRMQALLRHASRHSCQEGRHREEITQWQRNSSLRVCPGTSSGITKFSKHEAD
jgi:Mg2+ and Co2+ transporter CorA